MHGRFPALQRALAHAVMDYIRSGADPAERMIRHLVDCELDYINCDHPEFIGGRGAIRAVMQERSVRAAGAGAVAGAGGKLPGAGGKGVSDVGTCLFGGEGGRRERIFQRFVSCDQTLKLGRWQWNAWQWQKTGKALVHRPVIMGKHQP